MKKDTIITLDDKTKYALLDEIKIKNKTYFFAIKLDKENNPTIEYEVFEEEIEDEDIYMNIIEDEELKESLMVNFSEKFIDTIDNAVNK